MTNLSAALPIDLSYAETHNFTCPRCGQPFSAEIWLIVDAGARPDLLARIRGGEMHAVACPTCGPLGMVDAPLLIYRRDAEPAVLFSPAQQTSTEQDRTNALDLMERLRASLGDAWQEEWTAQGISGVQRAMLPAVLSDDPEAALRQMQREMDEALERLRTEDPEAFRQLEKAAREAASSTQRRQDAGDAEDDDSDEDEELPPALAAALAEVIDELRDAGVTIASPEDLETALAARPDLQARLERAASATDLPGSPAASRKVDADTFAESLPDVLNRFLAAETWDESQRIVEQHPQLLSDEADARFALALEENADDPDGVAFFSEHRSLLQRCREVGIARAFAEKMLPAESLAQAEQMGLTPEEFLAMQRAAQQMPPALREVLAELAANGVEIRSQEDLEAALAARPDLQAKLAAAIGGAGGGLNIPPEFRDDLQAATEAEQRYRRSGNQTALDSAAAAWERILGAASFRAADARFPPGRVQQRRRRLFAPLLGAWASPRPKPRPGIVATCGDGHAARLARPAHEPQQPGKRPSRPLCPHRAAGGLGRGDQILPTCGDGHAARLARPAHEPQQPGKRPSRPLCPHRAAGGLGRGDQILPTCGDGHAARLARPALSPQQPGNRPKRPLCPHRAAGGLGRGDQILPTCGDGHAARLARPAHEPQQPGKRPSRPLCPHGRLEDLEEAIKSYQRAVTGTPPDSPDLPSRLNNLGNGLSDRYARTGRLEDLEEAIKSYQRAVTGTPPDSPDLPSLLNNLGTGLSDRYARTGRLEDLEEAINSYQRAVTGTPPDSPDLPSLLNNLGNGLRARYARTGRLEDLEEAITSYQRAVTGTPPDSPDLPSRLNNLGNGLRARYARTGRLEDLEEAIKSYQRAVTGTPPDSPDLHEPQQPGNRPKRPLCAHRAAGRLGRGDSNLRAGGEADAARLARPCP
jgi:exonuclease VII small subunit